MLATFVAPFRSTDTLSKVWLVFFLAGWFPSLWRWLQSEQRKSWPSASGRIDSAHIGEPKRFLGLTLPASNNEKYNGVLSYSYILSGTAFQGEYRRAFASEEGALEFLRGLEGQPVSVQYSPNIPARSVLLEDTVETLLRNREPPLHAVDWKDSLPRWFKPLIAAFAVFAFVGLVLSIWVHIGALFGQQTAPDYFFWGLYVGIFVVYFPAVFVAQKRLGTTQRKDFWKAVTKGSPDGLRYLLYFFFAYAFINSIVSIIHEPPGIFPKGLDPGFQWRGSSSVWMVFYCASFAILSSALRSTPNRQ